MLKEFEFNFGNYEGLRVEARLRKMILFNAASLETLLINKDKKCIYKHVKEIKILKFENLSTISMDEVRHRS